jgi:hypothetical protein
VGVVRDVNEISLIEKLGLLTNPIASKRRRHKLVAELRRLGYQVELTPLWLAREKVWGHGKSLVKRKNSSPDARYGGARKTEYFQNSQLATCASRRWFLLFAEPDIHWLSRARRPSQKIEFVFSASPETIRREPLEFDLLRSVGNLQDLAACALL